MSSYLHDFRRTITSPGVLAIVILMTFVGLFVLGLIGGGNPSQPQNMSVVYYYNDGYHVDVLVTNSAGGGIGGLTISSQMDQFGPNGSSPTPTPFVNGTTNSNGLVHLVQPVPDGNYSMQIQLVQSNSNNNNGGGPQSGFQVQWTPVGQPVLASDNVFPVAVGQFSVHYAIMTFTEGQNGSAPDGLSLNYVIQSQTPVQGYLGTVNQSVQSFPITVPSNVSSTARVTVNLTNPTGNPPIQSSQFQASNLGAGVATGNTATTVAYLFVPAILGFFVPLMAMLASYSSYGRDRVTGVLESTLARPVTKGGLIASRFVAVGLALSVAIGLSFLTMDIALGHIVGAYLPLNTILALFAALLVSGLAFASFVFLSSHLVKSTGALVGIIIMLFLALSFFGSFIVEIVVATGGSTSASAALQAQVYSWYLNPASFFYLVKFYLVPTYPSGQPANPASFGVTLPFIIVAGVLWSIAGFLGALFLARKRD